MKLFVRNSSIRVLPIFLLIAFVCTASHVLAACVNGCFESKCFKIVGQCWKSDSPSCSSIVKGPDQFELGGDCEPVSYSTTFYKCDGCDADCPGDYSTASCMYYECVEHVQPIVMECSGQST